MVTHCRLLGITLLLSLPLLQSRVKFNEPNTIPAPTPITNEIRLETAADLMSDMYDNNLNSQERNSARDALIRLLEQVLEHPREGSIQTLNNSKETLATLLENNRPEDEKRAQRLREEILVSYQESHGNIDPSIINVSAIRFNLAKKYINDEETPENFVKARKLFQEIVRDYQRHPNTPKAIYIGAKLNLATMLLDGVGGNIKISQARTYLYQIINECKNETDPELRTAANSARYMFAEKLQLDSPESAIEHQKIIREYYKAIIDDVAINRDYAEPDTVQHATANLQQLEDTVASQPSPAKRRRVQGNNGNNKKRFF